MLLLSAAPAAGLALGNPANSVWEVMVWTAPLTVSVDTSSIATHAARITARVLWDYAAAQKGSDEAAAPYKSMIGLVVFDCVNERLGGAGSVSYSGYGGAGDAVARYSISPEKAALSTAEPGTVGYDLLAFVCARARQAS
jgi:hypothetical protein